ncbi:MAG: C4-dicarboxylate ABC transporter substrate-binding protein, partial [Oscillospiraceae bacterium]|nr:C4-dicarboxylate ABC transporter substrate-binding protein [Oscillospiraceae bacterium]
GEIPGGTYGPVADATPAVAVMATIIASNDLSADVVYNFVKGMFDYQDDITAGHSKGAELSLESAVSGISIPFHPGAQQYFQEVGAM